MGKGKKRWRVLITGGCVIIGLVILICCFTRGADNQYQEETGTYIKAVHYFGDAWPITFWNSELDDLDGDMEQIVNDGFNTVILVIPWREFQPEIQPTQYNANALRMLADIFKAAGEHGLSVMLRVGYLWDYYDADISSAQRFMDLMSDESTRQAWMDFADMLYRFSAVYDNFAGGFLCWEDFWNNLSSMKSAEGEENLSLSKSVGYQDYLMENYTLEEVSTQYGTQFSSWEAVGIPEETDEAFALVYEFFDWWQNQLLYQTQEIFPGLSMEVRTDSDLIYQDNKETYYRHTATYSCEGADYTTIVYGIPTGFDNQGQEVSAREAVKMTKAVLQKVNKATGYKKLFIDQFLFTDNTPGYEQNVQIRDDELGKYFDLVEDTLKTETCGYGIWTYHDYVDNVVYNADFALELKGWVTEQGTAEANEVDGSQKLYMAEDTVICQSITGSKKDYDLDTYVFSAEFIKLQDKSACEVEIEIGGETQVLKIEQNGVYQIEFQVEQPGELKIKAGGEIYVDDIRLYTFTQNGKLYDLSGAEEECIDDLRELNANL